MEKYHFYKQIFNYFQITPIIKTKKCIYKSQGSVSIILYFCLKNSILAQHKQRDKQTRLEQ